MRLYKLTDQYDRTRGGCQWGPGVTHTEPGAPSLCQAGLLHAYIDPRLAVLLNPIGANFDPVTMHLWLAEGEVGLSDKGLKVGCRTLTTIRRMSLPKLTPEIAVRFAILCVLEVYDRSPFVSWANKWLSGENRTKAAAAAADSAASADARAAGADARAAGTAAWAASAVAWAAGATWAAAADAAAAAAAAADAAAAIGKPLDLKALARRAFNTKGTRC